MDKRWVNRKEIDTKAIIDTSRKYNITPAFAAILLKREIDDIEHYLHPGSYYMHDSMELPDMDKACNLIYDAIKRDIPICIVNDYDVDGATSGCILEDGFKFLGASNVVVKSPNRLDGYGISNIIIKEAYDEGYRFIVTCDNGIAAVEPIEYAKSLGMVVVVTDHHEVPFIEENNVKEYILPPADAIVDPKRIDSNYPFKEICGASVAYKLISVLMTKFGVSDEERVNKLCYLGELLALGTVADVMPLVDENRMYVKAGLSLMKRSRIIGIRELMDVQKLDVTKLKSYHLGFVIGPCINAASRITGKIDEGMKLLTEKDYKRAKEYAVTLKGYNDERKKISNEGFALAKSLIDESCLVNMIYLKDIPDSICGIIAGKIKESTGKPAIVVSDAENGFLKGSGRSISGYNIFEQLLRHKDLFESFGGHAGACGLTITKEKFDTLKTLVNNEAKELDPEIFVKETIIDLFMPMSKVDFDLVEEIELMEPFGEGNQKPCFAEEHVQIRNMQILKETTIKMNVVSGDKTVSCIMFGGSDEFLDYIKAKYGEDKYNALWDGSATDVYMDFIYSPGINEWNGMTSMQYVINDYK